MSILIYSKESRHRFYNRTKPIHKVNDKGESIMPQELQNAMYSQSPSEQGAMFFDIGPGETKEAPDYIKTDWNFDVLVTTRKIIVLRESVDDLLQKNAIPEGTPPSPEQQATGKLPTKVPPDPKKKDEAAKEIFPPPPSSDAAK